MIERHGTTKIPHLVINRRDKANSLTVELLAELTAAFDQAVEDGARAIVLTGANGRFCSGADLEALTGTAADAQFDAALGEVTERIVTARVVVIAAVERYAFGAGVDLAWSCDVVVVAEGTRVAVPATSLGILYNPVALRRLHSRVGSRALRQLLIAGREIPGIEIADVVTGAGQTLNTATDIAAASTDGVVNAIGATKQVLDDFDHGRDREHDWESLRQELLASPDRIAALRRRGAMSGD